jgi:DNA-binding NarL/FixJ family response regulator
VNSPTLSLVLADPHPVMLDGLRTHLKDCPGIRVCESVSDGDAAWEAVQRHRPDFLVLDLALPRRNGIDLIAAMHAQAVPTQPIVFTSEPVKQVLRALHLGVRGLVSKQRPHEVLVNCIRQVHAGQPCLDQDLTMQTVSMLMDQQKTQDQTMQVLTPREVDVARMVTEGWPNKKIASKLCISEGTAKLHLHHIYQKLNCPGRMALMLYMQQHGY